MDVLALVTQKGGTGKSSLAVSLAVAAQERGLKASIIDIDPQGTASAWQGRRQAEAPDVAALGWSSLSSRIRELEREAYDLAIVDTPGSDSQATTAAIRAAQLCLLPVRPSVADIEAARPTIRELSDRGTDFAFVLNQCPAGGRTARTGNAVRALQLISPVADAAIALRADHMDALAFGLGVTEYAPRGKAADEIRALLDWVLMRLKRAAAAAEAAARATGMRA